MPFSDAARQELLCSKIGDLCNFRELQSIIDICFEESIYGISHENQTRHEIARQCVEWALMRGQLEVLIAGILRAKKGEAEFDGFLALVKDFLPGALSVPPTSMKSQVDAVITALDSLNTTLGQREVREHLSNSKQHLIEIQRQIQLLAACKDLHDHLHRLQLTPVADLIEMAKTAATNPRDFRTIRGHVALIDSTIKEARLLVPGGAGEGGSDDLPRSDPSWISQLQLTAARCRTSLDEGDSDSMALALQRVANIVEGQSVQLNMFILDNSRSLPLNALEVTLRRISEDNKELAVSLGPAIATIGSLQKSLKERVAIHNQLQAARQELSFLAECLQRPKGNFLAQLNHMWSATRDAILTTVSLDADAEISAIGPKDGADVDSHLLLVERAVGGIGFDPRTDASVAALQEALADFQYKTNAQFFDVDYKLKGDFHRISLIGERLGMTLGGMTLEGMA